ncbi:hypothetical protein AB0L06_23200 [Spirillospora sp. NPDC052269]
MLAVRSLALATATCSALGAAVAVPAAARASTVPWGATRVVSLNMPRSGEVHWMSVSGHFPITGMVQQWDGARWTPLRSGHLRFDWRMKGSTVWHDDGQDVFTREDGTIRASTGVIPGTWSLRVRVLAGPSGTRASTSAAVTTSLKDKVRFWEASAWRTHEGQPTQVTGEMTDYFGGRQFVSLRGRKVRLYYRRKGTKTWHLYKTTTLRAATPVWNERFAFNNLKRGRGYYFRVVFPAQGFFLSATSRTLALP